MDASAIAGALYAPRSEQGRAAREALRRGDPASYDAMVGATDLTDGQLVVAGPLVGACDRLVCAYDGLYDTEICDPYRYLEPLLVVLADAPDGTRAASLRDRIEALDLRYGPPTTSPAEDLDVRLLLAFPRLRDVRIAYPAIGGDALGDAASLRHLGFERGVDRLTLPPDLESLRLCHVGSWSEIPTVDGEATPRTLAVDTYGARALRTETLAAVTSLVARVDMTGDAGDDLSQLLARVGTTLTDLGYEHRSAEAVHVPARLTRLANLTLYAYRVRFDPLPALRRMRLSAFRAFETGPLPALEEAEVDLGEHLAALSGCPSLHTLTVTCINRRAVVFPAELPALRHLTIREVPDLAALPVYPTLETLQLGKGCDAATVPPALRDRLVRA